MRGFFKELSSGRVLVADGAMGTMLMARGLKAGEAPESLNLERPEVLVDIARLYLEAGADIIQTNTFGASPLQLAKAHLEDAMADINRAAVEAVRSAVGDRAFVSASVGPSGLILKPYGDADPDAIYESYNAQAKVLADAGADIICVETMTDLAEAVLAVRAAKAAAPNIPIMATMTYDSTPRGFFTIMGVTVERAAVELAEAGADVIGSNCGNGIDNMVKIAREYRAASKLPIIIQSNAGLPQRHGEGLVYPETPEYMAARVKDLIGAGVSIIGGCCGTAPEHIAAIRKEVDHHGRR
jgi:5-methyltetrahydrofolate--homocysteine methyltransferase